MDWRKLGGYPMFLHLTLVALAAMVVLLALDNRALRGARSAAPPAGPAIGTSLTPIDARDLDGRAVRVDLADAERETLLFVWTTTCQACQVNFPNWLAVVDRFDERYRYLALSLDSLAATRRYVATRDLPFEVLVATEPEDFLSRNQIAGVPQTIHAGRDGRVLGAWLGVLSEDFLDRGSLTARASHHALRPIETAESSRDLGS